MPSWAWWGLISVGLCSLSWRLAGALVRAHQRGVQVHVLLDAHAQPHHPPVSAVARLVAAGIAVSLDARHTWAAVGTLDAGLKVGPK